MSRVTAHLDGHGDHISLTKASLDGAGREGKGKKERKGMGRWKEGEMQGEGGREKKMEKGRKRDEKGGRGRKSLLLLGQFLGTWDLGLSFDLPKAAQDLPHLIKQSAISWLRARLGRARKHCPSPLPQCRHSRIKK